jgi:hypothetical protein
VLVNWNPAGSRSREKIRTDPRCRVYEGSVVDDEPDRGDAGSVSEWLLIEGSGVVATHDADILIEGQGDDEGLGIGVGSEDGIGTGVGWGICEGPGIGEGSGMGEGSGAGESIGELEGFSGTIDARKGCVAACGEASELGTAVDPKQRRVSAGGNGSPSNNDQKASSERRFAS